MESSSSIIVCIAYYIIGCLFWFSLYQIFEINNFKQNNQFILLCIYFLCEILSILLCLCTCKPSSIDDSFSDLSSLDQNSSIDHNIHKDKASEIDLFGNTTTMLNQTRKPFVGVKYISFIFPSICDIISKTLIFNGIILFTSFTFLQPLLGIIISVAVSAYTCNKNDIKLYKTFYQTLIGAIISTIGLIVMIITYHIKEQATNFSIVPFILIQLGELVKIAQYYIQHNYTSNDIGTKGYKEIAFEGIFGTIITVVIAFIMHFLKCDYFFKNGNQICNGNTLESITLFINQKNVLSRKGIFTLIYILSCVIYNLLGVYTLQQSNVINRQVIDTCYLMPIMVYLFFDINNKIGFTPIYILSFGLMLLGAIFTCEIIPLPHNNKDNLEESVQKMNAKEAFIQ